MSVWRDGREYAQTPLPRLLPLYGQKEQVFEQLVSIVIWVVRGVIRFPHYTRFLTEETVSRLSQLYARDFEVLSYKPVIPA